MVDNSVTPGGGRGHQERMKMAGNVTIATNGRGPMAHIAARVLT